MSKLVLQLQVIVVVLTFFLIVIDHHICGASEQLRIYRGDHDTFENSTPINCTARNAKCTFPDTNSGCSRCRCFGRYKTYLRSFDRCVRDNELLFLPGRSILLTVVYSNVYIHSSSVSCDSLSSNRFSLGKKNETETTISERVC
jgi:hypothetical protein